MTEILVDTDSEPRLNAPGEPLIQIRTLVLPGQEPQLATVTSYPKLNALSDEEKRYILQLLGGLCELVRRSILVPKSSDADLVNQGAKNQLWGATRKNRG